MTKINLLIVFICSALLCNAQTGKTHSKPAKSDLAKKNILGNVNTIKTYLYPAKGDSANPTKGELHSVMYVVYNKQGNVVESVQYDDKNTVKSTSIHKYDKKGNDISDSTITEKGILISRELKKYNANNQLLATYYYDKDDSLYNVISLKYDKKGNAIEQKDSMKGSNDIVTRKYEYDAAGNAILEVSAQKGVEFGRVQKIYNAKGQMIETIDKEGQKGYCTYNKTGDQLDIYGIGKDGKKVEINSFAYSGFDIKGNWTTAVIYEHGKPAQIGVREIKYFEPPKPKK